MTSSLLSYLYLLIPSQAHRQMQATFPLQNLLCLLIQFRALQRRTMPLTQARNHFLMTRSRALLLIQATCLLRRNPSLTTLSRAPLLIQATCLPRRNPISMTLSRALLLIARLILVGSHLHQRLLVQTTCSQEEAPLCSTLSQVHPPHTMTSLTTASPASIHSTATTTMLSLYPAQTRCAAQASLTHSHQGLILSTIKDMIPSMHKAMIPLATTMHRRRLKPHWQDSTQLEAPGTLITVMGLGSTTMTRSVLQDHSKQRQLQQRHLGVLIIGMLSSQKPTCDMNMITYHILCCFYSLNLPVEELYVSSFLWFHLLASFFIVNI